MADMQSYSVTLLGQAGVQTPRASINARITNSETGATLFDYTGANALQFPAVLRDLSNERFMFLIERILGPWLVLEKAGLNAE